MAAKAVKRAEEPLASSERGLGWRLKAWARSYQNFPRRETGTGFYEGPERPPGWQDIPAIVSGTFKPYGMSNAARELAQAMLNGKKILVAGDFDADGTTSAAIIKDFLDYCEKLLGVGVPADVFLPARSEGHGINKNPWFVGAAAERRVDWVVAPDSGVNAVETVEGLRQHGIRTLVLDHHEPDATLANAAYIVNPHTTNLADETILASVTEHLLEFGTALPEHAEGMEAMTGAGISWVFCRTLAQALATLKERGEYPGILTDEALEAIQDKANSLCTLAAIGTIGDRAKLTVWPNNYIVRTGMAQLVERINDLLASAEERGISIEDAIRQTPGSGLLALIYQMIGNDRDFKKLADLDPLHEARHLQDLIEIVEYNISPPINASNRVGVGQLIEIDRSQFPAERIGHLSPALECLIADDGETGWNLARSLLMLNQQRRDLQSIAEVFKTIPSFTGPVMVATIPGSINFSWKHMSASPEDIPYVAEHAESKFKTYGLAGLIASDLANGFARPSIVFSLSWQKATHKKPNDDEIDENQRIEGYRMVRYDPGKRDVEYSAVASCRNPDEKNHSAFRFNIAEFIEEMKKEGLVEWDSGGGHYGAGGFKVVGTSPEDVLAKIAEVQELATQFIAKRQLSFQPEITAEKEVRGYTLAANLRNSGNTLDERKQAIKEAFDIKPGDPTYHLRRYVLSNVRLAPLPREGDMAPYLYTVIAVDGEKERELPGMVVEISPAKGRDLIATLDAATEKKQPSPLLSMIGNLKKFKGESATAVMKFEPVDLYFGEAREILQTGPRQNTR